MHWLGERGYTTCFMVAGGASMHLIDGARATMRCIPVVHEVSAGLAAEYFNEVARATGSPERAFALVTAGPGLTNLVTALAGAYLESRDLLVVGGQVKSTDLRGAGMRQRGIQEVDGVELVSSVTVASSRLTSPAPRSVVLGLVDRGTSGRPGPVFLEVCLDVQGAPVDQAQLEDDEHLVEVGPTLDHGTVARLADLLRSAERPVLLLGGGVSRSAAAEVETALTEFHLPTMTTWNAVDRLSSDHPSYAGRPNTWGQRSANILLQQCDLLLAVGTRLGLQQTGFNWEGFAPLATVVHVDADVAELTKGHPRVDVPVLADPDDLLQRLLDEPLPGWQDWLSEVREVRELLPLSDPANTCAPDYQDPYEFVLELSRQCSPEDVIIPCSSGGAFTVTMQAFGQQRGQVVVSNYGLASMGYGLGGAIGAAIASRRRTILVEGDGGFAQNCQELGTVAARGLPIKVFLFVNNGYASIRMTQRNYFDGAYVGCDEQTGLGFPDWGALAGAFGISTLRLEEGVLTPGFAELFASPEPVVFTVPIDPEQTYYPKIASQIAADGGMVSSPLHLMDPPLESALAARVMRYLTPVDAGDDRSPR